jgi:hypothetical protein
MPETDINSSLHRNQIHYHREIIKIVLSSGTLVPGIAIDERIPP